MSHKLDRLLSFKEIHDILSEVSLRGRVCELSPRKVFVPEFIFLDYIQIIPLSDEIDTERLKAEAEKVRSDSANNHVRIIIGATIYEPPNS